MRRFFTLILVVLGVGGGPNLEHALPLLLLLLLPLNILLKCAVLTPHLDTTSECTQMYTNNKCTSTFLNTRAQQTSGGRVSERAAWSCSSRHPVSAALFRNSCPYIDNHVYFSKNIIFKPIKPRFFPA